MDDKDEYLEPEKIYTKARELLSEMEKSKGCNGLLLTYDPEAEKFQFLAIHADAEEVMALLLSGMGVMRETIRDTNPNRTLN
jgi:hypothetical protein